MRIFVSGGCKNGKSFYAQHLAKAQNMGFLYYVATMKPVDSEDDERIVRHRAERENWGFLTIEQPVCIEEILNKSDSRGSFLLDSVTALLANEMFLPDGSVNENAADKIINGFSQLLKNIEDIVIVSDYIYSDAVIYDPLTEKYRESLAGIDKYLAKLCDVVIEVAFTNVIIHKGGGKFNELYKTLS
ncbi:MAG: bifunctional adenosylcobinamide kinase/adenosylcobinamide-phosphate guanylyltransferase [Defluviitaleaceae bacterium]|nr:bifunctional adenosylcobinamide kinase/adenosylcobinamide-phosphate guanylyltransferase [Defluviitaleaceae bacterium]MCL2836234.1 bifunctional adenosylcobinamide kinase/adenosylcobinamide-phosphate guanylyltransferase [Defluviitaleaceae bacterium]